MQTKSQDSFIKRGAELLRQGATLTDLSCPECASPLFRLHDGTLWCAKDEKKVVVIKEGQEPPKQAAVASSAYDKLEATLMVKVAGPSKQNREKPRHRRTAKTYPCTIRVVK